MLSRKQPFDNLGSTNFLVLLFKYKLIQSTPEGTQCLLIKVTVHILPAWDVLRACFPGTCSFVSFSDSLRYQVS